MSTELPTKQQQQRQPQQIGQQHQRQREGAQFFFFFFFLWVTGELSTLRQMMKVPNEPGFEPEQRPRKRCTVFFFFFFLVGYRGIVHPPSNDEGTERTWF